MIRKGLAILAAAIGMVSLTTSGVHAQGAREGIVVHGRWILEVTNPDGTVAERREFENSLQGGQFILAALLAQKFSMGPMDIYLGDTAGLTAVGVGGAVVPVSPDPTSPFNNGRIAATATTETTPGFSAPDIAVFKGAATAVRNGTVKSVTTLGSLCYTSTPDCSRMNSIGTSLAFSGTPISPLTLQIDQGIHVTVRFSFTSGPGS